MTTSTERRPRRAFATLVAGAIAAAGVAAGMGSAPAAEAATTTFTFGVAQLNIKRDNSEAQQRADLAKVLPDADLVHVNEGSGASRRSRHYNAAHDNRWHVFAGDANVDGHKEEILLARKSAFSPVTGDGTASGSKPICDLNGPGVPYPKVVNWRTYVHKASGRQVIHIGVHLPPANRRRRASERQGGERGLRREGDRRRQGEGGRPGEAYRRGGDRDRGHRRPQHRLRRTTPR